MPRPPKHPVIDGRRVCIACGVSKPFTADYFVRDPNSFGGLTARCKECRYKAKREWELANPEKKNESHRAFYAATREHYLERKQVWRSENREKDRKSARAWAKNNPAKRAASFRRRYSEPEFKLSQTLRAQVRRCIALDRTVYRDTERILGYSIEQLKAHLESTFELGMSWENYSYYGWHIDHIRPVSSFHLTNEDGSMNLDEVQRCWALKSLRALWGRDNMIKSNTWEANSSDSGE